MTRKKTGVRSPRKTSARPTRQKPSPVKLREGGRQSSPFRTEWKYLDEVGGTTKPDGAEPTARQGKARARVPPGASKVTYYKPPKKVKPFRDLTDEQVIAWYLKLPGDQRRRVLENTSIWKWFNANKRDHKKLVANQDAIRAGTVGIPPSTTEIATYLRLYSGPPCVCGFAGYPYEIHNYDVRKCFARKPEALEDDDDDDLPF